MISGDLMNINDVIFGTLVGMQINDESRFGNNIYTFIGCLHCKNCYVLIIYCNY